MTREDFIATATVKAERALRIPAGWWGTWRHVQGPDGISVRFTGWARWTVRHGSELISVHETRDGAIRKARAVARKAA